MASTIIRVSPWHLRRLFRQGKFWHQVQSGQLFADNIKNNHLSPEKASKKDQPYCTHSQTVEYIDNQMIRVALVHQYLAPDGVSLGGSGTPDPKFLEFNGATYAEWVRDTWYKKLWYWGIGWIAGIKYKTLG